MLKSAIGQRFYKIIFISGLIFLSSSIFGCSSLFGPIPTPVPTATPIPTPTLTPAPSSFIYQVKITAEDTGDRLQKVKVTIDVGGLPPLRAATDSMGIAIISVPSSHAQKLGRLIVESDKDEYERYELNINLNKDELPAQIELSPKSITPTVINTPTLEPIDTSTPTETPIPEPTETLTPTETPIPEPTDTPTPTETPIPEPTDTPTPTETPIPEPIDTPIPTETPPPEAVVITQRLNLRTGPGTIYEIISVLDEGEILDVHSRIASNGWIEVTSLRQEKRGWISADPAFVQINTALDTVPIVIPPPVSTLTPTPTLLTPVVTDPPQLLDPQPGAKQYGGRADLSWQWAGSLGPDDYFQVEIRNRKDALDPIIEASVPPIDVAWVKEPFYIRDYSGLEYDREYTWQVVVVRGVPPGEKDWSTPDNRVWEPAAEFEKISEYSEMRTLYIEKESSSSNGNGPSPTPCPHPDPRDCR